MSFLDSVRKAVKRHDVDGKAEVVGRGIQKVGKATGHAIVSSGRYAVNAAIKFQKYQEDKRKDSLQKEREAYGRENIAYKRMVLAQKMKKFNRIPF